VQSGIKKNPGCPTRKGSYLLNKVSSSWFKNYGCVLVKMSSDEKDVLYTPDDIEGVATLKN